MSDERGRSSPHESGSPDRDRRDFLAKTGRFAAVTPPAISMLLITSMNSNAVAGSGGGGGGGGNKVHGNNGWGNGGNDGTNPGSSKGKTAGSKSANVLR